MECSIVLVPGLIPEKNFKDFKTNALELGSKFANVCYSEKNFKEINGEREELTLNRIKRTLSAGHHSVYEHTYFALEISGIPKSLAMILNNQSSYATSEKSARYTKMNDVSQKEKQLYNKWADEFKRLIKSEYGNKINDSGIEKLSQENARYLTSVHTPTKLIHTISFRHLNYLISMLEEFMNEANNNEYNKALKKSVKEFVSMECIKSLKAEGLNCKSKGMKLNWHSLFDYEEYFGATYCANYSLSFAALAQAQKHRGINYQVKDFEEITDFFVPRILPKDLSNEWLSDLESIAGIWPQAGLLNVSERGTLERFAMKAIERLCGSAQWEIMNNVKEVKNKYLANSANEKIRQYLESNAVKKCEKNLCTAPCNFGPKLALERRI
ncbi:MAG: FAD-dependent thymidylate synthase [Candidatus Nanoarchaeia archaeon]|nr:FAD-dependent thymidylate synthase [Candidatus Nanoarchaeia archaeon]MDD5054054.1 FAD-dependent thymidylate synthase [Candidatus Nanoarchaeia archaeon]MDD5500025.1 FAD-dependent thymidylate synthase [Candidatus Nanoarchaeia archaeon]